MKTLRCLRKHRAWTQWCLAVLAMSWLGCGSHDESAPAPSQPPGWDEAIRLTPAQDRNSDPNVVEIDLEAKPTDLSIIPGGPTATWTYDGRLPGPLIRAKIGDRVIVHFTNRLPEQTTIHWHGLRVPAAMDGMPGQSQPPIATNASFDYDFIVPDASTFWYHPHLNSAAQVGDGLYGAFIVDDPAEPAGLGDEVVFVLSDMSLNEDGSLQAPDAGGDIATLFGREGGTLLVNGKVRPTLKARPGLPQRWRFINAARTRYYQLSFPNHSFVRIGGDGGLLTEPIAVDEPVLAPAERADLIVVPQGTPGSDVVVRWVAFDRGWGTTFNRPPEDLFVVHFEGEPAETPKLPAIHRKIDPLSTDGATPIDLSLTWQTGTTPLVLGINNVPFDQSTPLMATVGETQVWTLDNTMDWAHHFHLHGFFFQVLEPPRPLEWKDTVNVPAHETVRFVVRYDERPGMWMFHCHILDHAEAGMMGSLMLMDPPR